MMYSAPKKFWLKDGTRLIDIVDGMHFDVRNSWWNVSPSIRFVVGVGGQVA
jgi:hypothetical protein